MTHRVSGALIELSSPGSITEMVLWLRQRRNAVDGERKSHPTTSNPLWHKGRVSLPMPQP